MSLELSRVALVIAERGESPGTCGSGYLVRDGCVLTAAHVLRGDVLSVKLRFNPDQHDEWTATAEVAWSDPGIDVAVLRIVESPAARPSPARAVTAVQFGMIAQLDVRCDAVGFPWFMLRDDSAHPAAGGLPSQYREYLHAYGPASRFSGSRDGTLSFSVSPPAPHPDPNRSPWEGMSGAAVFSGDCLVGVIRAHHLKEGLGTLTASRVAHWYGQLPAERLAGLAALIGLPAESAGLWPVTAQAARAARRAPDENGQFSPEIIAAATRSYLGWTARVNSRLTVTALASSRGTMEIELERVYVGLKVDFSTQAEREAATLNRLRELNGDLGPPDLTAEQRLEQKWRLISDPPVAEHFGVPEWLKRYQARGEGVLTVGQLYLRDNASVILGDPGSGKTTIMRWLALLHAKAQIEGETVVRVSYASMDVLAGDGSGQFDLGRPLLPILVRVAAYAAARERGQRPPTLLEFIGQHSWSVPTWQEDVLPYREGLPIPPEILAQMFHAALRERRALIMLDGFDEVPAAERVPTADAVNEFIGTWIRDVPPGRASNKLIATSRIAGYHDAPLPADLTLVTIEPMTEDALEAFLLGRFTEVLAQLASQRDAPADPLAGEHATRRLLSQLDEKGNEYVRGLAANPLLAGVMVSVFIDKDSALPRQRVELYDAEVTTLTDVWRSRLSGTYSRDVADEIFRALPAVAAYIHENYPTEVIRAADFRDRLLAEVSRLKPQAPGSPAGPPLVAAVESLVQIMQVELGLLVASSPEAFRFAHRSFQEFLAAQDLIADPARSASRILDRLGDPRWREPILMAIGLVNWRHKDKMIGLTESLLAQDGPLAQFFPETALLLSAAIPQMTEVPPEVVRQTAGRLLASYARLFREQRMPRVRELLEAALATLRDGEHRPRVDAVLIAGLTRPAGDDPALACAAARMVRNIDAASPELAAALEQAAARWDMSELGSPAAEALGLMVSPPTLPENGTPRPRLAPAWGDTLLAMRDTLRAEPGLVAAIRRSPRWLALMLTVFGGCWNLGAAAALDDYERMSGYLRLDEGAQEEFTVYFGHRWGREEPVLMMTLDRRAARKEAIRRISTVPRFDVDAITRDSPLRWQIAEHIDRDDLAALTRFLRSARATGNSANRADALLALWALAEVPDSALAEATAAAGTAARRVAALIPGLLDATVRAAPLAGKALVRAAGLLAASEWELLGAALTKILHYAGADPVGLFAEIDRMPSQLTARVLVEEIAQRVRGWGDDPRYEAENFAAAAERFADSSLLEALGAQGSAWSDGYQRYAHWWPCDPLAFGRYGPSDIPLAVLDQFARLPADMDPFFTWHAGRLFPTLHEDNPPAALEVGVIVAARVRGGDYEKHLIMLGNLDAYFAQIPQRVDQLYAEAEDLQDPWFSARGLLRVAGEFPGHRPAALRAAARRAGEVADPVQAFQLYERLALLGPAADRAPFVSRCRGLAVSIPDPAMGARALLRLTRMAPSAEIDDIVSAAAGRIRQLTSRADQLELLRIGRAMFTDRPGCQAVIAALLNEIGASGQEQAHVAGRWGTAVTENLPTLCGDDETLVQALVPVALYARAVDFVRAGQQDRVTEAWRELRAGVSPDTVQRVLDAQAEPQIGCTGPVARSIDDALATADPERLAPILGKLVRMDFDAEPAVRSWLAHRHPRLSQIAGLLLAERYGISVESIAPVTELLLTDDDLLRARARNCVMPGPQSVQLSVTTMGPAAVTHLAQFALDHRWSAPGMALVFTRHLERLLYDDPEALSAWCDAVERDGTPSAAASIVRGIHWITTPAWNLLLDRLRQGSPALQMAILTALSVMVQSCADEDGDFDDDRGRLRIDPARWSQLYAVLAAIDPEPLAAARILPATVDDVFHAAGDMLAATEGLLSKGSGWRASRALWKSAGTSFGAILAAGSEDGVRRGLTRVGRSRTVKDEDAQQAVSTLREHSTRPDRADWPWTQLLTIWAADLLSQARDEQADSTECTSVLEALAAAAQLNPDTFRQHADEAAFSALLAEAGLRQGSYTSRSAAAALLGALRYGSHDVFLGLQQLLRDTSVHVRQAALDAILRLRSVDLPLIEDLIAALSGPSVTVAWAAAQLLGEIGENTRTGKSARDTIISALTHAVQDPRSRRVVHFAFADTPMPRMPELDDVFTETLRRVYRLG